MSSLRVACASRSEGAAANTSLDGVVCPHSFRPFVYTQAIPFDPLEEMPRHRPRSRHVPPPTSQHHEPWENRALLELALQRDTRNLSFFSPDPIGLGGDNSLDTATTRIFFFFPVISPLLFFSIRFCIYVRVFYRVCEKRSPPCPICQGTHTKRREKSLRSKRIQREREKRKSPNNKSFFGGVTQSKRFAALRFHGPMDRVTFHSQFEFVPFVCCCPVALAWDRTT